MNTKLLHTPDGVRDLYGQECAKKLFIEDKIRQVFHIFGYQDIQTPTFEFFDIFNKERGSVASRNMYKFFDREGNTLVLRPDITPSIARCVAKYYDESSMPVRLCYDANIFRNNSEHQGKLKETTQQGVELIGDGSIDACAEVLSLMAAALLHSGLKDFQIDIGDMAFFRALLEEASLDEVETEAFCALIESKSFFGIEDFLASHKLPDAFQEIFLNLQDFTGSYDVLLRIREMVTNPTALACLDRLEELYRLMELYGYEKYISFDFGMMSRYEYYTGLIFNVYTYGTGDVIATGGQYDKLLKQFGKDRSAVGMCIAVDQLLNALYRQNIHIPVRCNQTCILYHPSTRIFAIRLACLYRQDGEHVELLAFDEEKTLEDYKEYSRKRHFGGILYLDKPETIQIIDRRSDTVKTVQMRELLNDA